jgi:CheY-like chemotaxis protein
MSDMLIKSLALTETAPPEAGPHLHVLIVDDISFNRQILELFLDHLGATSMSVENGAQAVEAAELHAFDAILMDIQMPVMDGLSAIREIRRRERAVQRPGAPIVVVSANCAPEDVAAARVAGAQAHVAKPISMGRLFAALAAACDPEQQRAADDSGRIGRDTART